ncbi:hypothetical protein EXQ37_10845 [Clostridium botulinum]|nr:hypothetical protein [Clostridium botulinum]
MYHLPLDEIYGLHKTKEELESQGGMFIETLPIPQYMKDKVPIPYLNPKTKEVFYEYIDVIENKEDLTEFETQEEKIKELEEYITFLQTNIVEIEYNNLMKGVK